MKTRAIIAASLCTFALTGCLSSQSIKVGQELVWASHSTKPDWTNQPSPTPRVSNAKPPSETMYEFTGISLRHTSERVAKESALANASTSVIRYSKQLVQLSINSEYTSENNESVNSDGKQSVKNETIIKSVGILDGLGVRAYYTEQWKNGEETFFKTYALVEISDRNLRNAQER